MGSLQGIACERTVGRVLRSSFWQGAMPAYSVRRCERASIAGIGVLTRLWSKVEPLIHEGEQLLPTGEV
jgi:hypothetical protein